KRVSRAIDSIRAGKALSLTLSQSFRREYSGSFAATFSALRKQYPMPEMFLINLQGNEALLGASPDLQARIIAGKVDCAPVCGSSRRGTNASEDRDLGRELLLSEKEAASLAL